MKPEIEASLTASAREFFWQDWRVNIVPKQKRKPSVWASEERRFAIGQSPLSSREAIKFSHDVMPHCVEPMDAVDDDSVNILALMFARRMGKTENICMNVLGRTVTDDPGNLFCMLPIEKSAAKFSRDVLNPTIDITPSLRDVVVKAKSRDTGRTKFFIRYAGGSIYLMFPGSGSSTRGSTVKVMLIGEIDDEAYNNSKLGDVVERALGRGEGFSDAIRIIESTPTFTSTTDELGKVTYRSRIAYWHDRGDKRKWFCQCRRCGQLQWLKFEQIRYARLMSHAEYFCERCDAEHNEAQWRKMVSFGSWFPTATLTPEQLLNIEANARYARAADPIVRSYWINGFNSLLPKGRGFRSKLHQFVSEAARAKEKRETEQVWVNEVETKLWNPDDDKSPPPAYQPIIDGREDYATNEPGIGEKVLIPAPGLVLTAMTDVHGDRLEVEWRAWAKTEESWGVGHFVLFGDTNRTEVWDEWTRHLQKQFPHASGSKLALSLALIDGGWRVDPILATLRRISREHVPGVTGKITISKGVPQWSSVIHKNWAGVKDRAKGIHIGTWCAKALIYERLRWHSSIEKPSAGFIHFGKCYSEEFIRQIVSETSVFKIINAMNVETFKNPDGNRNEALDLLVGNLAAFRRRHWDFDAIEKELRERAEELKQPKKKEAASPSRQRESNFATDGVSRGRFRV